MSDGDVKPPLDRRALGRALSRAADATVEEILTRWTPAHPQTSRRIAITGAPGTGKSTLISSLARARLRMNERLGVIAIDPTSPFTRGAILGDRIRMDALADDPRLYIRSLASRRAHDGLADNVADILAVMDEFAFDEVLLETVGVGQADYTVRDLVDTIVLVLIPESGDQIQAMKAGLMEAADIYVVNKSDLPGARKVVAELRAVLRSVGRDGWAPQVVETSARDDRSIEALADGIDRHLAWRSTLADDTTRRRTRTRYQLQSLINRRLDEILTAGPGERFDRPLPELFADVVARLDIPTPRAERQQRRG